MMVKGLFSKFVGRLSFVFKISFCVYAKEGCTSICHRHTNCILRMGATLGSSYNFLREIRM